MPGLLDSRGGKKYQMLLITPSGREYMVTLTAMGQYNDDPPMVVWEQEDGTFLAGGIPYLSLDKLAIEFGCVVGTYSSVDPVN